MFVKTALGAMKRDRNNSHNHVIAVDCNAPVISYFTVWMIQISIIHWLTTAGAIYDDLALCETVTHKQD